MDLALPGSPLDWKQARNCYMEVSDSEAEVQMADAPPGVPGIESNNAQCTLALESLLDGPICVTTSIQSNA